jgi:hypothetical protein
VWSAPEKELGCNNRNASHIRPLTPQDQSAMWSKVEMLEGEASKKTGFTTADGVAE